jgi:hypothetical protein
MWLREVGFLAVLGSRRRRPSLGALPQTPEFCALQPLQQAKGKTGADSARPRGCKGIGLGARVALQQSPTLRPDEVSMR